jgi:hypothetical protein
MPSDELLYKSIGKTVDKSIKDAPYAADMKGKTVFMAINAEAILDLPVVKMLVGFGGKEFKTYSDLASKVSYLSVSSEGETATTRNLASSNQSGNCSFIASNSRIHGLQVVAQKEIIIGVL